MMKRLRISSVAFCLLCLVAGTASASVIINGTRVVFPAQQGETTVRLTNQNNHPALVEAWIDSGNVDSTPDTAKSPFLITPPLFRMEPNKDQSLRILYIAGKEPLPTDRESLFWLNVLEIPPKPTGPQFQGKNYLQFAIRSRLKLFYRPANLPGDSLKAPGLLTFKSAMGKLVVHNPTPYYITISQIALGSNPTPVKGAKGMVAPFGNLQLPLKGVATPAAGTAIAFSTINDYGAIDAHKATVSP